MPATKRSDRAASTSAPPGIWPMSDVKPGGGQDKTDVDLRPLLRGEKHRDERPKAGLHIGDEENEPIKPAQAPRGRPERRLGPARLFAKRRRGFVFDPVAPISTVAKAA